MTGSWPSGPSSLAGGSRLLDRLEALGHPGGEGLRCLERSGHDHEVDDLALLVESEEVAAGDLEPVDRGLEDIGLLRPVTQLAHVAEVLEDLHDLAQDRARDRLAGVGGVGDGAAEDDVLREQQKIREVVRPMPLLSLRGAVPSVAGVMNLRGQVVPVIDLGVQLGESPAPDAAGTRIIAVEFREADGRFISFHAKKARGTMARWMVEHQVTDPDAMRGFDSDGYSYDAAASSDDRWTFARTGASA